MIRTILLATGFIMLACTNSGMNDSTREQVKKDIKQTLEAYHNDIAAEGLLAEFKYLDSSSDFFWVPPGYNSVLSYDSVRSILKKNAKALKAVAFSWDTLQIFPLTRNIANYTGIVSGSTTDTSDNTSNVRIIESGTLIKRPDGWKLLNGQSAVIP